MSTKEKQTITNKSSQQKCFFAASRSYRDKADRTWAAIILPNFVRAIRCASAKTCYALHPHKPPLFCPLSPEAYLLTGEEKSLNH